MARQAWARRARRAGWGAVLVAALATGGALVWWASGREAAPPDVLLISLDTLRADHLGAYGYARPTSPVIDGLAREGVLFERATSHSPKTAISHMSLMTGLRPEAHGVRQWDAAEGHRLSDDIPTLARLLWQNGYATAAVTGGGHVRGELGFDQGVESYEVVPGARAAFERAAEKIEALEAAVPSRPWFLFLHTYELHDPYTPPEAFRRAFADPHYAGGILSSPQALARAAGRERTWEGRHELYWSRVDREDARDVQHLVDLYDAGIRYVDAELGRLLERLRRAGALDHAIVVLLSDHGEEFLDHGRFLHEQIYQELLHVPLVLVLPGDELRGVREGSLVRLVDVLPTLLDAVGIPVPPHVHGESLLPRLRGGVPAPDEVLSSWRRHGWQSLRRGEWKLVRRTTREGVRRELYDLAADPGERSDLAAERPELAARLEQRLDALTSDAETFQSRVQPGARIVPDEQTLEQLRALGYL